MKNVKIILQESKNKLPTEITIYPPIRIEESKSGAYGLIFKDNSGYTHYFDNDGQYDGWSRDSFDCEKFIN